MYPIKIRRLHKFFGKESFLIFMYEPRKFQICLFFLFFFCLILWREARKSSKICHPKLPPPHYQTKRPQSCHEESQIRHSNDANSYVNWDVKRETKINKTKIFALIFISERADFDCCFNIKSKLENPSFNQSVTKNVFTRIFTCFNHVTWKWWKVNVKLKACCGLRIQFLMLAFH